MRLQRSFSEGLTDEVAKCFDYRAMLAERLGEVWSDGSPQAQKDAVKQLHGMTLVTSETAGKTYLGDRPTRLTVRYTTPQEAWVHVTTIDDAPVAADEGSPKAEGQAPTEPKTKKPTPESKKPFQWQYRVVQRDGVWTIVQREYRVGNHSSRTTRFYRSVLGQLRKEYKRTPTLSEVVANVPSLARRMRVRTYRIPPPEELEKLRQKQAAGEK